ncbi:hypothetical protein CWATWH0003_B099 [Crocosphaera watsonii WH 0003]|uniref:Uncharacterized protein n=1 Tax=Crocosphaera watsonii WH 0003 TaxID=423471 RepID=G5JEB2_CROWT|nr:hypothetical protein CWATWH0003_B099 [Crocosphaera watsonii WH 0003]
MANGYSYNRNEKRETEYLFCFSNKFLKSGLGVHPKEMVKDFG